MNRQQRRTQVKYLQKNGKLTREGARAVVENQYTHQPLEEGIKVKLNWELMKRSPDWKKQRESYKEWVEAHKDDVFTVEWDKYRKENNSSDKKFLVCLKEDETNPKWLFYSSTLIPQATLNIKLDDGTEITRTVNADKVNFVNNKININEKIDAAMQEALEREKENNYD